MPVTRAPGRTPGTARDDPSAVLIAADALSRFRSAPFLWLTLLPPALLGGVLAATVLAEPAATRDAVYGRWFGLSVYGWAVLAPVVAALYAGAAQQTDAGAKRVMYGYAFPRRRLLYGTLCAVTALWAGSGLLFGALAALTAVLHGAPGDVPAAFAAGTLPVVAALPMLVVCTAAAEAWGIAGAVCAGTAGTMFGALLGDKSVWWFFPPAWPTRAAVPLAEAPAPGGLFPPGHPMSDPAVLPVLTGMALALAAALTAATALYVDRRPL
ncbi:ABC-2 family transporter permease [Nocardiopsis potens]|uniref:hypothetical protein n=1 Tax=Nocardiopsis potens TaxID=1246458 RepID=UPI000348D131|nr:hypothetical protein [Nocardiopsis potens]